ncbi:hypothetical protein CEUSTIGMA_g3012.t1 [Chlamydomonas eustigma]|uniref:1-phosphatidylinositol 4-kinase n=1 Tax=Chlamydomonas eustigma TaxID=1157962 RepID=A0A250WY03_9CHLO|nr:hypothetical protein CEUSTIGMA_g3012.t1 [Chlamydomonas eustigma]|eukprot:GAX75569.1 hypothetical protein CEUSTIGMA_g3012.t1 [Chlamydomonas eustigma]
MASVLVDAMTTTPSSTALDSSFPTTFGFHTTKGFDVPISRPSLPASTNLRKELLEISAHDAKSRHSTPEVKDVPVRASPDACIGSVGWKGLLEMSKNSGTSGIVGAQRMVDDTGISKRSQIEVCATAHTNSAIRRLVKSVIRGLTACQEPERTAEGMGGTYFFCNENGRKVAIVKPCDEEPLAPNNPKGYVGRSLGDPGWKPTVRVGEAAMREVAAYLLDRDGFSKVPTSVLVRARHPIFCYNNFMGNVRISMADLQCSIESKDKREPQLPMKLGSLQEFIPHECDTTEMGPSKFCVKDVHHIGILDIRLFNTDRHAGNMLVRPANSNGSSINLMSRMTDSPYELIPIDHGFCLPETLEAPYFEWLHWPQAMLPFSEEELMYIKELDFEADKKMLSQELPNLRPECIRVLELTTSLLKRCAEAGMTLFEIGNLMSRPYVGADEEPSELEKMCGEAKRALEMHEIAEEDEVSSESTDDFIEEVDEDENGDVALEMGGQLIERRRYIAEVGRTSMSREEDGIMFDIEGDHAGLTKVTSFSPQPDCSPTQYSHYASSNSSSFSSRLTENIASIISSGTPLAPIRTVAQSIHGVDGFMWRMKSQRRQQGNKSIRKQKLASPQAYPPKVIMAQNALLGGAINFGEFDEKSWARFKQELVLLVDTNIKAGKWRQSSREATGGVAMSCPRF